MAILRLQLASPATTAVHNVRVLKIIFALRVKLAIIYIKVPAILSQIISALADTMETVSICTANYVPIPALHVSALQQAVLHAQLAPAAIICQAARPLAYNVVQTAIFAQQELIVPLVPQPGQ
jgi:hypothetical protein